jgi:hypothetical protein
VTVIVIVDAAPAARRFREPPVGRGSGSCSEIGNRKSEIGNRKIGKSENRKIGKSEIGNRKSEIGNRKSDSAGATLVNYEVDEK